MIIRITLLEEMLGTSCQNADVHKEFIASKSKDADRIQEELEALPADALMEKAVAVFARDDDGTPMIWDYQFKGFLKEAAGVMLDLEPGEIHIGRTKLSKYTFKRVIDNYVFVSPRRIRLAPVGAICTRPLRADTMRGERVALASSETVPAGTSFELEIKTLSPALDALIERCLDYGQMKGIGQWRNSGKGRFLWEDCNGVAVPGNASATPRVSMSRKATDSIGEARHGKAVDSKKGGV